MIEHIKKLNAKLNQTLQTLLGTGFGYVFFSSVVCKALTFFGGLVVVRILPKSDYGAYTYIMNCYGMTSLLNDLGCGVAAMQFCNENYRNQEKFNGYFAYGTRCAIRFSLFTVLLVVASPLFYPFNNAESARLTQMLLIMPLLSVINTLLLINLRVRLENKKYAAVNIIQTVVHYLVIIPLTLWLGIRGAILSNYVIALLVFGFSIWVSQGQLDYDWTRINVLTAREKHAFLKLAVASQLNNALGRALVLLDIFMLGIFVSENTVISSYKVGSTIPFALAFIPDAVMTYAVPYFARNRWDKIWVRRNYKKLIAYGACGNAAITGGLLLLGPWLIPFLFGVQYRDAVIYYSILMVGYFFSATFRTPSANVIYTQGKVRVNIIITIAAGIGNCIADILLILHFGSVGAAIATTAIHIFASALSFSYMLLYLKDNKR